MDHHSLSLKSNPFAISTGRRESTLYFFVKRSIDTVLVVLTFLLLLPLLLAIAIFIKLDSSGPVLFVQERVGARRRVINGRIVWEVENFSIYKFRSMTHNADQSLHREYIKAFVEGSVQESGNGGAGFKLARDSRVTRMGKLLRQSSLDELPQLINVLKGEMSLVGPRPVPTYEVEQYEPWHHERLCALPGITGLWQVEGRGRVTFDDMIRMDIEYVRNKSLWLDLKILFLTVPAVLMGRGAQ